MNRKRPSLRLRAFVSFLLLNVLNVYAGGVHASLVHRFNAEIAEHNRETLERLGVDEPRSPEEIAALKARARRLIASSRAPLLARQAAGQRLKESWIPKIWDAQDHSNLKGLSEITQEISELTARILADPDAPEVPQLGRTLWLHRQAMLSFSARLAQRGQLPQGAVRRIEAVSTALSALGDEPHAIDAVAARAAAGAARATISELRESDARARRLSRGGEAPNPQFLGRDPLTGLRIRPEPTSKLRAPLTEPREPVRTTAAELMELFQDVPSAAPLLRQAPAAPPEADDLAATIDAPRTQAIVAKAAELDGDPLALYNFVLTGVDYLPYNGSLYGGQGALDTRVGNDVDQASLLISLLRASDIPARYATGAVVLTPDQVRGMTGFQSLTTAANALTTQGVSATVLNDASGPFGVRIQHTWVLAWVPYTNYRGLSGVGQGGEGQWVNLAPAIKRYELDRRVELSQDISIDLDTFISSSPSLSPRSFYEDQLREWIATTGTRCETLDQGLLKRVNRVAPAELLPNAPPFELAGDRVLAASLGSSLRHSVNIQLADDWGFTVLNTTVSSVEAYGKKLAITFPSGSGIYSSLSGSVKPTLSLGGNILSQSSGMSVGTELVAYVQLRGPGTGYEYRTHDLVAGGTWAINVWKGPVPDRLVAEARAEVANLTATGAAQNRLDLAISQLAGLSYFNHLYQDDSFLYALGGHLHSTNYEAATGTSMTTLYFFGFPSGVDRSGFSIDAENSFIAFPLQGSYDQSEVTRIAEISGLNSSFYEHAMWGEALGVSALATTNILQLARAQGQTIHYLSSISDYNAIKGQLSQGSAVHSAVQNALNRGDQVVISDRGINQNTKTVSGWIEFDNDTGSGRYMISTLLNGGETTELKSLMDELASLLGYGEPINSRANMSTGSLSDQKAEQIFRANGRLYALIYNYNSDADLDGDLGPGWTWTFGAQLFEDAQDGKVSMLQWEGVKLEYTPNGDGTYTSPTSVEDSLVKTAAGFTLTSKQGRVRTFDTAGRLTRDSDTGQKALNIERDRDGYPDRIVTDDGREMVDVTVDRDGHLTKLEDVLGRTTTFAYTDGYLTEIVDPTGERWTYVYSAGGRLIGKLEPDGSTIQYSFDGDGRLARHTTPSGGEGYFGYDWDNLKSTWQDPAGADQLYTFDQQGQLLEHVDEVGNQTAMTYEDGRLTRHEDGRGGVTTREYDARGNLIKETRPDGTVTTWTFDAKNRMTSRTLADGSTTTWIFDDDADTVEVVKDTGTKLLTFNDDGNMLSAAGDGADAQYTYDSNGNLASSADAEGNVTQITSDAAGQVVGITNPGGETFTLTLDQLGRLTEGTLPSGASVEIEYTPLGDVASTTDPAGRQTHMVYNERWLTSITDQEGRTTTYVRDDMGRIKGLIDANGNELSHVLDPMGRITATTDVHGQTTEMGYCADVGAAPCDVIDAFGNLIQRQFDDNGRLVSETTDLGSTSWEYDSRDRVTAFVDALGNRTEMTFDVTGNLTQVKDALNQTTTYTYDATNFLTSITDASGATTQIVRNDIGQVVQVIDALSRVTELTYAADRKLSSRTDARGHTTTYQNDELGQITAEVFEDGTSHSFVYDAALRKLRSTSEAADLEYKYNDPKGRLSQVINHTLGATLSYEYDAHTGLRSRVTRPDGTQTYTWNRFGQLAATTLPNGKTVRYAYDDHGRLYQKTFPNGNVEQDTYDAWSRLTARLTYDSQGVLLAGTAYTYDSLHRKTSATDAQGRATTYTYDALSRLTGERRTGEAVTYTYDAVGNRLTKAVNGQVTTTYTYDDTHRLLSKVEDGATTTYTWDEAGRLTAKSGAETGTFEYSEADRLTHAQVGAKELRFAYDAEGRRAWRQTDDETVSILYDHEDAILELDEAGTQIRGFGHGPGIDDPVALFDYADTGDSFYYHTDGMGSVVALSDPLGRLAAAYSYSAFGELTTELEGVYNDYAFTGRRADRDMGTYDFRARELDPALGRYMQADPLQLPDYERTRTGLAADMSPTASTDVLARMVQPQSQNPYGYVSANPLNHIDPNGESDVPLGVVDYLQGLIIGLIAMCLAHLAVSAAIPWLGTIAAAISIFSILISLLILAISLKDSSTAGAFFFNLIAGIVTIGLSIAGLFLTPLAGTILFIIWMHVAVIALMIGLACFP